ncbi:transcriptional regulator ATRX [Caerostris extrusa]|uniref:Transcriptional regulator ATRX n=1 Tax=Caerostris extrusa TaxID=172846 RepID=A0AAV4W410_CAEEX|nr:transcriptional regulator ATRX [Caerostris extrusa]
MSRSKSIKHVIKKLEEIVNSHKVDLNNVIKSLCHKYVTYLEKTKSENENETDLKQNGISNKTNLDIDTEKINSAIDTNDETKVNNKLADSDQGNQEMNKDESKMEVDNKSEVIDANYQAKLALLNESDSDDSFTTGALPIDDVISNLYSDDEKPKTEKSKESESKVARGKIRTMNNDAEKNNRKVDNDLATTDRKMDNGLVTTPIISKTASSSSELDSDDAEIGIMKSKKVGKKPVNRKLAYLSSSDAQADSESSIYISSDDGKVKKKVKKKVKRLSKRKLRGPKSVVTLDDPKLYFKTSVKLERCDHLIPEGETTITLPVTFLLEELDRQMHSLCKEPKMKEKSETSPSKSKSKSKETPMKAKAPQKMKIESNSSSSICLSSDEEDETTKKKLFKPPLKESNEANSLAKKNLLASSDSDESIFSINGEGACENQIHLKRAKEGKGKQKLAPLMIFNQEKKENMTNCFTNLFFSDDSDKDSERKDKDGDRKKPVKKKPVTSDDNKSEKKKNSDSTTTESEDEKQTKKKKRRRIKKAAASSSDSEKKEEGGGTQTTPGKSRKKIRKILTKEQLAEETKEAQNIEKERRKRVLERQKMYNMITDTSKEGNEIITRKMVLEVDPESKEEVVEIHPDLVEKLKPHQVNGVKFMWECTIESLKRLEKERGSGCILAHCMGLGKTLQVITFLHTCLTNRFVRKHIKTAMVICPYNTVLNWSREFDHWLKDIDGEVLVHELTIAKDNMSRLDILKYWHREGGVLIISYDLFRRLASTKIKNVRSNLKKKLVEYLLDPGHVLKNVNSAVSKACATLATQRRIVLTGTPLQNNLLEYHCMLSFVKPHLLGTPKEFRNRFVNPIMNGQYDDSNENDVKRMKKRIHILHKLLGGCVQRCDYAALTKFLPSKHEFVISVKLSEVQINMYRWYLDNLSRAKGQVKIRGGTLFMDYNILRNLCTHPYILKKSYERAERKEGKVMRREDFINDEDEDEIVNDDSEVTPKSNASDSDIEEIVKVYKTRSRRRNSDAESVEEEPLEFIGKKQWFDDFFSDEDQYKLELSGKMVLLMEILKECEAIGDKVIVFSQSLLTFDIIEDMLNNMNEESVTEEEKARDIRNTWIKNIDYFRMDGSTSAEFRKQYIDHFNDPLKDRSRLFLVSTKAGGLGTNLVGANRVVMLDASWNPSHDVQAIFRVYRFGQKKPVYIYRFLAQGTMEEKNL